MRFFIDFRSKTNLLRERRHQAEGVVGDVSEAEDGSRWQRHFARASVDLGGVAFSGNAHSL